MSALPEITAGASAEAHYRAHSTWEFYAAGECQLTSITRTLRVRVMPSAQGPLLTIASGPPVLQSSADPAPLVELAQRLAAVYAHLELQLTPTGEVADLLNYEAVRQAGEQLLTELRATTAPDDQVTAVFLAFTERQLASPAALLHSLQFDYLYQALLPGLTGPPPGAARAFAGFFAKTTLWFIEQPAVVGSSPAAGVVPLRLRGLFDPRRTDLATVRAHQVKALQLATPTALSLPDPHFCYEATYNLELATGLPQHAELTVYARAGQLLNKEYHLTLNRL